MKVKVIFVIMFLASLLFYALAEPVLGFGKYLDKTMQNWSIEEPVVLL